MRVETHTVDTLPDRDRDRGLAEARPQTAVLAVAAIVVVAFATYGVLGLAIESPRIFVDELRYWNAAASLADGDGLTIRGERYTYAPLYPLPLAVVLAAAPDREVAYELAKLLNALFFALAAVPLYLLARRLLSVRASAVFAALSVAVPSAMYVSVVMTESLAFLAASWALYAIVLALERPTPVRQGSALVAILVAFAVRPQFAFLVPAYLAGLVLVHLLLPDRRRRRETIVAYWPTALSLAVLLATFLVLSPRRALGGYEDVWRSYDPVSVADWFLYHLANLELYVAVVPFAVAPIVLASSFARARRGSRREAAFVALFLGANAALLLVAAITNDLDSSLGRLHDRYTFYLVPLWLLVLFVWLRDGAPRPLRPALAGAALALVLPVFIPFSEYAREDGAQRFAGVASTLWAALETGIGSGRLLLAVFVVALVAAAFALPRRSAWVTVAAVALVFAVTSQLAWFLAVRDGRKTYFASPSERRWVDERVPEGRTVTLLLGSQRCDPQLEVGRSRDRTEFFNASIRRAVHVGPDQSDLPSTGILIGPDGRLGTPAGGPVEAELVLAPPQVQLDGRLVAEGTPARLGLWEVDGVVRAVGRESVGMLEGSACPG